MSKPELTHEIISFKRSLKIMFVDTETNSHQHVLGALNNLTVRSKEVSLFERLKSKIIIIKVTGINKFRLYQLSVVPNNFIHILSQHGCCPTNLVLVVSQSLGHSDDIF